MTETQGVLSHVLDISECSSDERQDLRREWEALAARLQAEVSSFEKLSGTPPWPPLGPHSVAGSHKQRFTSTAEPARRLQKLLCSRETPASGVIRHEGPALSSAGTVWTADPEMERS